MCPCRQVQAYAYIFNCMVRGTLTAQHYIRVMRIADPKVVVNRMTGMTLEKYIQNVIQEFRKVPLCTHAQEDYCYGRDVIQSFRSKCKPNSVRKNMVEKLPYFLGVRSPRT